MFPSTVGDGGRQQSTACSKMARREDSECSQHKEMTNVQGDGWASYLIWSLHGTCHCTSQMCTVTVHQIKAQNNFKEIEQSHKMPQ